MQYQGQSIGTGIARGAGGLSIANDCQPKLPPQSTLVANTCQSLDARAAHLHSLIDRLHSTADRVFGSEPTAAQQDEKGQPYHCDASRISESLRFLDAAVERLERVLPRLEQI